MCDVRHDDLEEALLSTVCVTGELVQQLLQLKSVPIVVKPRNVFILNLFIITCINIGRPSSCSISLHHVGHNGVIDCVAEQLLLMAMDVLGWMI